MIVDRHVWRTVDNRFVEAGDPEAAFLAYAPGAEVSDPEAARLGLADFVKSRPQASDKMRTRGADKATKPGPINRQ